MRINRRDFLKATVGSCPLLALTSALPGFLARAAIGDQAQAVRRDTILVVIQMTGGNDGLNTVIPFEDDIYHRKRPTLHLTSKQVHHVNNLLGFHPDMSAFHRLFQEGHLSILQGTGVPGGSRNHETALLEWQTGAKGEYAQPSGWAGRAGDYACDCGLAEVPGAFVGTIPIPFIMHSERTVVPAIASLQEWTAPGFGFSSGGINHRKIQANNPGDAINTGNALSRFMREAMEDAGATARRVQEVASRQSGYTSRYPQHYALAQSLCTVSQLIGAEAGIRIYCVELGGGGIGGFDTHAGQAANHGALLRQLAESVSAFVEDLRADKLLDQVLVMTYSEFGRTVTENGRRGTNHGAAAPMFLAGGRRKATVFGNHPSLNDLDNDGLKCQLDFRKVYATILDCWLGLESSSILRDKFSHVEILEA